LSKNNTSKFYHGYNKFIITFNLYIQFKSLEYKAHIRIENDKLILIESSFFTELLVAYLEKLIKKVVNLYSLKRLEFTNYCTEDNLQQNIFSSTPKYYITINKMSKNNKKQPSKRYQNYN